jgi:hypothetical protein
MPMQLDGITLTADDHGAGRAAVDARRSAGISCSPRLAAW